MPGHPIYAGIDGCKDGWFCVFLDETDEWSFRVFPDAYTLAANISEVRSALIDIPIGLVDQSPQERLCDKTARKLLGGKRASSVFPTPARQTLSAESYEEALDINRASTGKGLSRQSWAIVPKILETDRLLSSNSKMRDVLRECHPELCFWALNGQSSMAYNKKKKEGKHERLLVLEQFFPQCKELFERASTEFLRKQVAHDDIIDAMVCAITAKYGYGQYATVPESPSYDSSGLPMEMVYWVAGQEMIESSAGLEDSFQESELLNTSSRRYRQLEEVLSWRLMTEIHRRYPARFKLIEAHPGGGQGDCLVLLEYKNTWQFALDVNRGGGSIHFYCSSADIDPYWVKGMLADDPKAFIDQICRRAKLPTIKELPVTTPETLTYRFITEFLTHTTGRLEQWYALNGYLDTSGISPSNIREKYFRTFPAAKANLENRKNYDVNGVPAYRFWFLVKNDAPWLCLETTGKVYRLDGKVVDIVSEYKEHKRIWPLILSAAIELLP